MIKIMHLNILFILFFLVNVISCTYELREINLNETKRGSLKNNEYDYYKITLPAEIDKDGQIVFELEPDPTLDAINNIVSDPNLYISIEEDHPNELRHTWASNRFGDETISIGGAHINPFQYYYIGVHCPERCNYMLRITHVMTIPLEDNIINSFTLKQNTVMRFSFHTKPKFTQCIVNVVGSYLASFNAYLAESNPSSSNTLTREPTFINGYRFLLINNEFVKNSDTKYELTVDNRHETQELNIWLKYDDENIKVNEAEIAYDSIVENKANCYYYDVDIANKKKDIIISTVLFNGMGFLHIGGFTTLSGDAITSSYKNKENTYAIIQNKVIHITYEDLLNYKNFNPKGVTSLNFCFYAEKNTSLAMKVYFYENYQRIQKLNYLYPGIEIEDILPKKSLTRYQMENFDVENDLHIFLSKKTGNPKLYLFMRNPDRNKDILEYYNFQPLKKANEVFEGEENFEGSYLILTKESNRCKRNKFSGKYSCILNVIIECDSNEECIYDLFFDHAKTTTFMKEKVIYSNVISQKEQDNYSITVNPSITNIAIVLTQNTGKTILHSVNLINDDGVYKINDILNNNDFLPGVIKVSKDTFKTKSLEGVINFVIEGISYASYSLYYYTYNENEIEDHLDQDKVSMVLEKGKIIKDIFLDNHKFKIYMYDSSKGSKTDLFVTLLESDFINYELYIFKDLADFSISNDKIYGYLWKGDTKDFVYIDKKDRKYIDNDIFYIMIYRVTPGSSNIEYNTIYLGVTDETTPFLLSEGIEFKNQLNKQHSSQSFYYNYINNGEHLKISLTLLFGHVIINVKINNFFYTKMNLIEESNLILIPSEHLVYMCQKKTNCGIEIDIVNDQDYIFSSSFLITVKSSKDTPVYLKQGVITKRTVISGEEDHFIVDIKPDKSFGAKISVFFMNGEGEVYARRALRSELFDLTNFPDQNNYEYMATYKSSNKGFYLIEIPYDELIIIDPCKILLTVKGLFPGYHTTKIDYSISISNVLNELITDKNYRLFISQGEIIHYHFRVTDNKKRLYVSMTNKDKDANMFLNFDKYITTIADYNWKNIGSHNEYIDISAEDPLFVNKQMDNIDGDYYLAIKGLDDCFFNLYISTQDVKIMTLEKGSPAGCTCESENDNCYFRFENINNPSIREVYEQDLVFYTEYTYGSGGIYGKLYPNGNMEDIVSSLPSKSNHDIGFDSSDFLYVCLKKIDPKYTFSSVFVVGIQCKEKALFDITAVALDKDSLVARSNKDLLYLKLNQDNFFYLSKSTGRSNKFIYYISKDEDFNFQVKNYFGKSQVHVYTNKTRIDYKFSEGEDRTLSYKDYHHVSDFVLDSDKEENKNYYGFVSKEFGKENYLYIEVKPFDVSLININVNYNDDIHYIPINKEVTVTFSKNYNGYFDILPESEELVITVTALDKIKMYDVYLKMNLLSKQANAQVINQTRYSKPNSKNYDIKGTTNLLTSAISLRVKNVPLLIKHISIVRILVNIEAQSSSPNQKVKIEITPVINNINRIRPQPNTYYFTGFEKEKRDKNLYTLKSLNKDDDLMVIEISMCKGNFMYALVDAIPKEDESYTSLKKRQVPSTLYSSNGKSIIIVRNLEVKEYYLIVYGDKSIPEFLDTSTKNETISYSEVDMLFKYYTTSEKKYQYLFTQDILTYDINFDNSGAKIQLPELKKRDTLGRENYADFMNYTLIVTDKLSDFYFMESTCYLTKLIQKNESNKIDYLKIKFDEKTNSININGFLKEKIYYLNILAKNERTGEAVTYKPIMINTKNRFDTYTKFVIIFLIVMSFVIFFCLLDIYRRYRIEHSKIQSDIEKKSDNSFMNKIGNLKNINLNVVKKKYSTLNEDSTKLNES